MTSVTYVNMNDVKGLAHQEQTKASVQLVTMKPMDFVSQSDKEDYYALLEDQKTWEKNLQHAQVMLRGINNDLVYLRYRKQMKQIRRVIREILEDDFSAKDRTSLRTNLVNVIREEVMGIHTD